MWVVCCTFNSIWSLMLNLHILVLSLFSVVRFANTQCYGSNGYNGTCLTSAECSQNGGTSSGSCASGFGVCCTGKIFIQINCFEEISLNFDRQSSFQRAEVPSRWTTLTGRIPVTRLRRRRLVSAPFTSRNAPPTFVRSGTRLNKFKWSECFKCSLYS